MNDRTDHLRVCDAAVLVLRETGNRTVMTGDCGLLHIIAERAATRTRAQGWFTEKRILDALSRQPGDLVAGRVERIDHRAVRCFWLPEHAPAAVAGGTT